ncbi:MAG: exosome complex protein Rrp42 [Candidatus Thermoplasmatota archaeon]|nr:exosome complex protein Rrp42 [Candidatus Thermoplasmatota archaeon]
MTISPVIKQEHLYKLVEQGKRADGRQFNQYRPITIEPGIISKAEGSARVRIGNTQVIAGIKMSIGDPYPDTPDSGVITTAAELIPLASPDFEAGPPDQQTIELARVVDRGIRESEVIDLGKLCIIPGEKIWIIFIDIHIIDYDGNLFDAASLAALAALFNAKVPITQLMPMLEKIKEQYPDAAGYLQEHPEDYPLPLRDPPISCTFVKFNNAIVVDPSIDEQDIAEARITVATDPKGDIRAMQKGLKGSFTADEIKKIIKDSVINGSDIRKILKESVGT